MGGPAGGTAVSVEVSRSLGSVFCLGLRSRWVAETEVGDGRGGFGLVAGGGGLRKRGFDTASCCSAVPCTGDRIGAYILIRAGGFQIILHAYEYMITYIYNYDSNKAEISLELYMGVLSILCTCACASNKEELILELYSPDVVVLE